MTQNSDKPGLTSRRQKATLAYIEAYREYGATVAELRDRTGLHHGSMSGVLSNLHEGRYLVRLAEKRDHCHVYVTPGWVDGRETQAHGRTRTVTIPVEEYRRLLALAGEPNV